MNIKKLFKILALPLLIFPAKTVLAEDSIFTMFETERAFCNYYNIESFERFFKDQNPFPIGISNMESSYGEGKQYKFGINGKIVEFVERDQDREDGEIWLESKNFNLRMIPFAIVRDPKFDGSISQIVENDEVEGGYYTIMANTINLTKATLSDKNGKSSIHYIGYMCSP